MSTFPSRFDLEKDAFRVRHVRKGETRTDDDHVELETTLQELVLNLLCDGIETDIRVCSDFFSWSGGHCWKERRGRKEMGEMRGTSK